MRLVIVAAFITFGALISWLDRKRRRAEAEVACQAKRAQRYLDVASVIMLALDAEGRITLINAFGCKVLGYSEQELLGQVWFDRYVPEWARAEARGAFARLIAGDERLVAYFEHPILARSGEQRYIGWSNAVLRETDGHVVGAISSGEDITERLRAQKALWSNVEFLETWLDALPCPVFHKDVEGIFQGCNRAFADDILRLPKEEIIGRSVYDLTEAVTPEWAEFYDQQDMTLVRRPGDQCYRGQLRCADGLWHEFEFRNSTSRDANGRVAGIVGILLRVDAAATWASATSQRPGAQCPLAPRSAAHA